MNRSLQTARLLLRPVNTDDFSTSLELWSDPQVVHCIGGQVMEAEAVWRRLLMQIGHWQVMGYGSWTIIERSSGHYVGELGFFDYRRALQPPMCIVPEAGWALRPAMQGRGYALEALQAALDWAQLRWPGGVLSAIMDPDHIVSARLAGRAGFQWEARASHAGRPLDIWRRYLV
ncbi:GNAT family N-acetyltransferase [Frateuria aurantia]|uniref:Acetyltransferase, ribosomal protein N-acetylase n=1 Tax=Frateuria aurantia (strain ATCC 33424 / DSM 6220 / KCTC 2777 / LMG 1558 / NBRC 3245 / NCIMB 13370) TaxID=767434 RepID=H8L3I1_FRAAD|nr:GNAT family N-acetyltransferase [Frateuria aurantia]AFC86506.1 acetyltransferase, ribosomal protein N-acetylase [Frateuria aurantia DSM 6220]